MMKNVMTVAALAGLLLTNTALAAINAPIDPAHNMDDVMSLGVVYINHNSATTQRHDPHRLPSSGQQTEPVPAPYVSSPH